MDRFLAAAIVIFSSGCAVYDGWIAPADDAPCTFVDCDCWKEPSGCNPAEVCVEGSCRRCRSSSDCPGAELCDTADGLCDGCYAELSFTIETTFAVDGRHFQCGHQFDPYAFDYVGSPACFESVCAP